MPEQLRADARQNRERILQVAHDAFAADPDVSLNAIAKRAGVGAGTLYRHFPTREDLLLAVYAADIRRLVDSVPAVLDEHPPVDALRVWFLRLADYVRIKHGLGDALNTAAAKEVVDATYAPVVAAIADLLAAGGRSGDLRPGLDPADVLLLMGFLWRVPAGPAGLAQAERMLAVVIEGLRPTA